MWVKVKGPSTLPIWVVVIVGQVLGDVYGHGVLGPSGLGFLSGYRCDSSPNFPCVLVH